MRAATIFAIISGASALSIRAECPTASGSACGTVVALGNTVTYPKCDCKTTCSGPVSVGGITATVVSNPEPNKREESTSTDNRFLTEHRRKSNTYEPTVNTRSFGIILLTTQFLFAFSYNRHA